MDVGGWAGGTPVAGQKAQKTARNQFRNRVRGRRSWPTHGDPGRAGQGLRQPPWAGRELRPFRPISRAAAGGTARPSPGAALDAGGGTAPRPLVPAWAICVGRAGAVHGRDRSMAVLVWPGVPGPFFGLAKSISLGGPGGGRWPIRGITSTHQPLPTNPLACPPPPHDAPLHCIAGLVWVIANAPYLNTIY
jgi:hypothetical protein